MVTIKTKRQKRLVYKSTADTVSLKACKVHGAKKGAPCTNAAPYACAKRRNGVPVTDPGKRVSVEW